MTYAIRMVGNDYWLLSPDILVLLFSAIYLLTVRKGKAFRKLEDSMTLRQLPSKLFLEELEAFSAPAFNTYITLPVIFLISISFPSILNAPYFVLFLASTMLRMTGSDSWKMTARLVLHLCN